MNDERIEVGFKEAFFRLTQAIHIHYLLFTNVKCEKVFPLQSE